jgi:hypothetical protein
MQICVRPTRGKYQCASLHIIQKNSTAKRLAVASGLIQTSKQPLILKDLEATLKRTLRIEEEEVQQQRTDQQKRSVKEHLWSVKEHLCVYVHVWGSQGAHAFV